MRHSKLSLFITTILVALSINIALVYHGIGVQSIDLTERKYTVDESLGSKNVDINSKSVSEVLQYPDYYNSDPNYMYTMTSYNVLYSNPAYGITLYDTSMALKVEEYSDDLCDYVKYYYYRNEDSPKCTAVILASRGKITHKVTIEVTATITSNNKESGWLILLTKDYSSAVVYRREGNSVSSEKPDWAISSDASYVTSKDYPSNDTVRDLYCSLISIVTNDAFPIDDNQRYATVQRLSDTVYNVQD